MLCLCERMGTISSSPPHIEFYLPTLPTYSIVLTCLRRYLPTRAVPRYLTEEVDGTEYEHLIPVPCSAPHCASHRYFLPSRRLKLSVELPGRGLARRVSCIWCVQCSSQVSVLHLETEGETLELCIAHYTSWFASCRHYPTFGPKE